MSQPQKNAGMEYTVVMTTRAGLAGLLTGLIATVILVCPLGLAWPAGPALWTWMAVAAAAALTIGGGWVAGRWSGSAHPGRCAALGGLAGGLAGSLVFCWLGAAAAGLAGSELLFGPAAAGTLHQSTRIESVALIVYQTQATFLASFLGGIGLGGLGGWLACPRRSGPADVFDRSAPQMALNAAITAVPATVVAAALAAATFSRLADSVGRQAGGADLAESVLDMPLTASLLLVLVSQLALTLIVPHEARQAEHRCGLDEVKMAAYVGIGASPVLALLLLLDGALFAKPLVGVALLAGVGLSLKSLQTLFRLILPRRAAFPAPPAGWQQAEAKWFGTIANSNGPRLAVLCIGCGLVMILPLHVTVFAVLVNLTSLMAEPALGQFASGEVARKLFLTQALVSTGLMAAVTAALTALYLFYLNLGRWFNRRGLRQDNYA